MTKEDRSSAIVRLTELQNVQSEDSQVFTRLAIEAIKHKKRDILLRALSKYIVHQSAKPMGEFALSLLIITLETTRSFSWTRKVVGPTLSQSIRRVKMANRAEYQSILMLIEAIGLIQCNKPIGASVRFQKVVSSNRQLFYADKVDTTLWVLAMLFCSMSGRWSRVTASFNDCTPENLNSRLRMYLRIHVLALRDDMKIVKAAINSRESAKQALRIAAKRAYSHEVLSEVSRNLNTEYLETEEYLQLLNSANRLHNVTRCAADRLEINLIDEHSNRIDIQLERERIKLALAADKASSTQEFSEQHNSWVSRKIRKIRNQKLAS